MHAILQTNFFSVHVTKVLHAKTYTSSGTPLDRSK